MRKSKKADGGVTKLSCSVVFPDIDLSDYPQVRAAVATALDMLYEANAFQLIKQRKFFKQDIGADIMDAVQGIAICRAIEAGKIEIDSHPSRLMPKYTEVFMRALREHFASILDNYAYLFNLIEQGIAKELQTNGLRR